MPPGDYRTDLTALGCTWPTDYNHGTESDAPDSETHLGTASEEHV
jgi:hypothetical protein